MTLSDEIPGFGEDSFDRSIAACFAQVVEQHADRIALQHGDASITYRELDARSSSLAHTLIELCGAGTEPVVLLLDKGILFFIASLAVWKAGKFIVPLDPTHPPARISHIREDVTARFILTDSARIEMGMRIAGDAAINLQALQWDARTNPPVLDIDPDAPFAVVYTSGSTGRPKGVVQLQRNILFLATQYAGNFGISVTDRVSILCSLSVISAYATFLGTWLSGGVVCLQNLANIDMGDLVEWLYREQITLMQCVPSLFRRLCSHLVPEEGLPQLRLLVLGGELITRNDLTLFTRHFRDTTALVNYYGSTECSPVRMYFVPRAEAPDGPYIPIGYPVDGITSRIVGPDGRDLPSGEIGQIVINTRYCSTGYWGKPEATAHSFRTDPDDPTERSYYTGDIGSLDANGRLTCYGRNDFQVKFCGFRIEVAEIELALQDIPSVKDAVVIAHTPEDAPWNAQLVAYLTPRTAQALPSAPEMRRVLRETLPEYMIPAVFIPLTELPLTDSNKLDRRALPTPQRASRPESLQYQAPQDELEVQLVRIWEGVLGIKPVGITDDFFDLGGNSLLAMEMIARIEENTGVRLPTGSLINASTISRLTPLIRQGGWTPLWTSLRPLQTSGTKPPFFCVTPAGGTALAFSDLARCLGPDQPFYVLQEPDVDSEQPIRSSIEESAAHYIREMFTVQAHGPYYLAGASFGGVIAFEMAQQLRSQGHAVAFLGIIDSIYHPDYKPTGSVKIHAREFIRLPWAAKGAFLAERVRRFIELNGSFENVVVKPVLRLWEKYQLWRHERAGHPAPISLRRAGGLQYYRKLTMRYISAHYPGQLTLFRASSQASFRQSSVTDTEYLGWHDVCDHIDLRQVEGGHLLFQNPALPHFATELQQCLTKAREGC
ncbi:MAG: AMP-binding protein [Armatimonadota bacterium]